MRSQFSFVNQAAHTKRVRYEGTNTIYEGMALCYNYDTTTNSNDGTTAEGSQNEGKYQRVEEPTLANSPFFAGVIAGSEYEGKVGPRFVDIYVPNGAIVPIYTDKSITAKEKLYLEASANTIINAGLTLAQVATAVETKDRSSTAGIVLAKLTGVSAEAIEVVTATSRTTVQLPTAAIWDNFDLKELRDNPFAGAYYDSDFRQGNDMPANAFTDAASNLSLNAEAVGALQVLGSVDNEAVEIQLPGPITTSGGNKWAFECRVKQNTITNDDLGYFIGIMTGSELVGDLIADNGASMADVGSIGFQLFHADGNAIDAVYDANGQTAQVHDTGVIVPATGTYDTMGMYYDGTDIQVYINGVNTADPILGTGDIDAVTFPSAVVMVPTIATKNGAAEDDVIILDWIRFAQIG